MELLRSMSTRARPPWSGCFLTDRLQWVQDLFCSKEQKAPVLSAHSVPGPVLRRSAACGRRAPLGRWGVKAPPFQLGAGEDTEGAPGPC